MVTSTAERPFSCCTQHGEAFEKARAEAVRGKQEAKVDAKREEARIDRIRKEVSSVRLQCHFGSLCLTHA